MTNELERVTEASIKFGFIPTVMGLRHRSWWIVDKIEDEELQAGASIGDLCIKARDGASNPIDVEAFKPDNFINSVEDGFDCTYRYYYYSPINT